MAGICSVSIDVDPVDCYYRIHSLGPAPREYRSRILCASLPRYAALFADRGIRATFFIVAEDIDTKALGNEAIAMRAALREVREQGHEIASHSYSHPYELARMGAGEVAQELGRAHTLLSDFVGAPIRGFRAPGYDISAHILRELLRLGYAYDSSIFPAPGYYAAKALVMALLRLRGRPSGAVMTNAKALWAPIEPYHPDPSAPWKRGEAPLRELPIAVTARTRTPVIGTNLIMAPQWLREHWLGAMRERGFFNLEMHGIDLCDAKVDGLPEPLARRQPDLQLSAEVKVKRFGAVLDRLRDFGFVFEPLRDYAARA